MVNLNDYRDYFTGLLPTLGVDRLVMVVQEEHLRKRLPGLTGTVLAVVYPSASGEGTADNIADMNTALLFVLENANRTDSDPEREFLAYCRLQDIAMAIKACVVLDYGRNHPLFVGLDPASFRIDPEWNIAGSYNGYSLAFNFIV